MVGGGYCRVQMPLRLALGVRETVAGRRLGALKGRRGGGLPLTHRGCLPPFQCIPGGSPKASSVCGLAVGGRRHPPPLPTHTPSPRRARNRMTTDTAPVRVLVDRPSAPSPALIHNLSSSVGCNRSVANRSVANRSVCRPPNRSTLSFRRPINTTGNIASRCGCVCRSSCNPNENGSNCWKKSVTDFVSHLAHRCPAWHITIPERRP